MYPLSNDGKTEVGCAGWGWFSHPDGDRDGIASLSSHDAKHIGSGTAVWPASIEIARRIRSNHHERRF
jgi:hypothetical protein